MKQRSQAQENNKEMTRKHFCKPALGREQYKSIEAAELESRSRWRKDLTPIEHT